MKIEHFARCMKEIKLKLSAQEMSDLQKALLDINADFITYEKFLTCCLEGIIAKDVPTLQEKLSAFGVSLLIHRTRLHLSRSYRFCSSGTKPRRKAPLSFCRIFRFCNLSRWHSSLKSSQRSAETDDYY